MGETESAKDTENKTCVMCGQPGTRLIISNKGCWTLCSRESCWNRLQNKHPQSDLTWMTTPLDEEEGS